MAIEHTCDGMYCKVRYTTKSGIEMVAEFNVLEVGDSYECGEYCKQLRLDLKEIESELIPTNSRELEWQPIETAPKDGNWIICTSTSSIFVWLSPDDGYYGNTEPTHWKPLPEPPKEQGS